MGFDENILSRRIKNDNSWWVTDHIPFYGEFRKRRYYDGFFKLVQQSFPHRAVVLMGPRRVGKTVMMYQAIQDLLKQNIPAEKIWYFSLDTPIYTKMALEELMIRAELVNEITFQGCYIFFDEIQYLKDWEVHLKSLVDSYRDTKFIVSGSAAAALKMKSQESGAGRFSDFFLPPFTFAEYIDLNQYNELLTTVHVEYKSSQRRFFLCEEIELFNQYFVDYINFGGFPEIALNPDKIENPEGVIQREITEKVIMKDLPGLFGIENILELQQFFNVIAFRTGEILSYGKIIQETDLDEKTVKKFLIYLESAFLIKILHRVDLTARRLKNITQFKVYLTNPSLFTGLFGKVSPEEERFPHLVETAIFDQYLHRDFSSLRYARWEKPKPGGEVDLIQLSSSRQKPIWALEIKWSDSLKTKSLEYFVKKNELNTGFITSKTKYDPRGEYFIAPSSVYAYAVGKNALDSIAGLSDQSNPL